MIIAMILLTFEYNDGSEHWEAEGVGVANQVVSLQGVSEGNPHQIPKGQHVAEAVIHQVHGGQDGLLEEKHWLSHVSADRGHISGNVGSELSEPRSTSRPPRR